MLRKNKKLFIMVIVVAIFSNTFAFTNVFAFDDLNDFTLANSNITTSVNRIYANQHVFGEDEVLDTVLNEILNMTFNEGRIFIDIHTISQENLSDSVIGGFSSCSPGHHNDVVTTSTRSSISHICSPGVMAFCTFHWHYTWICRSCNTTGSESSHSLFPCNDPSMQPSSYPIYFDDK